jgi:hypothetical protein
LVESLGTRQESVGHISEPGKKTILDYAVERAARAAGGNNPPCRTIDNHEIIFEQDENPTENKITTKVSNHKLIQSNQPDVTPKIEAQTHDLMPSKTRLEVNAFELQPSTGCPKQLNVSENKTSGNNNPKKPALVLAKAAGTRCELLCLPFWIASISVEEKLAQRVFCMHCIRRAWVGKMTIQESNIF